MGLWKSTVVNIIYSNPWYIGKDMLKWAITNLSTNVLIIPIAAAY